MADKYSLTQVSNLYKTKFGPMCEALYNTSTDLLALIKKTYNLVGDYETRPADVSFGGGVGSGSLPTANSKNLIKMEIRAKKMYAVVQADRESIKAAQNEEGAYERLLKYAAVKGAKSWSRNLARAMLNELDNGSVGEFSGNQAGTASAPEVTITAASWKSANIESADILNVNSDASTFEIISVNRTTRVVTLSRLSGALDLTAIGAGTHKLYMQNSKDNDPESIVGVLLATSGTKYGVTIGDRFQATQVDASAAAVSEDILNQAMLDVEFRTGEVPDLIACSFVQMRKLLNLIPSSKRYPIAPADKRLVGKFSVNAVEFMSTKGVVPIIMDRFLADDTILCLNKKHIEICHRPDFGWFDDDGTVWLRDASSDSYSARYGGYLQVLCVPSFHAIVYNLAV
jgi:hypothetical protein